MTTNYPQVCLRLSQILVQKKELWEACKELVQQISQLTDSTQTDHSLARLGELASRFEKYSEDIQKTEHDILFLSRRYDITNDDSPSEPGVGMQKTDFSDETSLAKTSGKADRTDSGLVPPLRSNIRQETVSVNRHPGSFATSSSAGSVRDEARPTNLTESLPQDTTGSRLTGEDPPRLVSRSPAHLVNPRTIVASGRSKGTAHGNREDEHEPDVRRRTFRKPPGYSTLSWLPKATHKIMPENDSSDGTDVETRTKRIKLSIGREDKDPSKAIQVRKSSGDDRNQLAGASIEHAISISDDEEPKRKRHQAHKETEKRKHASPKRPFH
ncbi:MAG: hypothetical protein M1821_008363 [Bathelium mastoideum]|nr:MAG: hypothetical protein M1821_008363 [Bathelium mastoideum]